jgi:hypothetical protein
VKKANRNMLAAVVALVALLSAPAWGQDPVPPLPAAATAPDVPALTETQKMELQNWLLRLENAQLRAQQAARVLQDERSAFVAYAKGLEAPGYTLDISTLTYRPAPAPAAAPAPPGGN